MPAKTPKQHKIPRSAFAVLLMLAAIIAVVSIYSFWTLHPNFGLSYLNNRTNALYGLPNASIYTVYYQYSPAAPNTIATRGALIIYSDVKSYGLNSTQPLILGSSEPNVSYRFQLPEQLMNASYPVVVNVQVYEFSNSSGASEVFDIIFNGSNFSGRFNKTTVYDNISTTIVYLSNPMLGNRSSIQTLEPLYASLELSQEVFQYKNYIILVPVYGVLNKYNINYTREIAAHIYFELSGNNA